MQQLNHLKGDIFGGLTAAVVALPLALAFGVASGAGALAGLYGAIFVGLFAVLFGGTPTQISGPTGPMTVVMAILFTRFCPRTGHGLYGGHAGRCFSNPVWCFAFWTVYQPGPLSGYFRIHARHRVHYYNFTMGTPVRPSCPRGCDAGQAGGLIGITGRTQSTCAYLRVYRTGAVYLTPAYITRYFPPSIIALVFSTIVAIAWLPEAPVIGEIPSGLPDIHLPVFSLEDFPLIKHFALVLAFLGSIDSLLTSLVADSMTRSHHNSDRELIGQGMGNIASGIFGGITGAGATMRTVVNFRSGGKTPFSGVIHSLMLFVIVMGFSGLVMHIPHAVLAGILLRVGFNIIDWRYLKRVARGPQGWCHNNVDHDDIDGDRRSDYGCRRWHDYGLSPVCQTHGGCSDAEYETDLRSRSR